MKLKVIILFNFLINQSNEYNMASNNWICKKKKKKELAVGITYQRH